MREEFVKKLEDASPGLAADHSEGQHPGEHPDVELREVDV